jgi:hypothetical protein
MKKSIKPFFLVITINAFLLLTAQPNQVGSLIQFKSPEVHAFEKYGNIPVKLYTGMIDLNIPIYNISLPNGKNLDITLSYDSSGFMPHKKNGNAGYNWTLLAGGRITRNINGMADEYIGHPTTLGGNPFDTGLDLHGFLHGVRLSPYTNAQVYNLSSGVGQTSSELWWWLGNIKEGYEGEPDLFQFSILDLQGKFMVGNDGKVLVESNDPNIKVDISQLSTFQHQLSGQCIPAKAEIKIIDGKGNIYIFGGDMSKYEIPYYRISPVGRNHDGYSGFPAINSYSISKIIFINGEEVLFEYLDPSNSNTTLASSFCDVMSSTQETMLKNNPVIFSIDAFTQYGARIDDYKNCPGGPGFCTYEMDSHSETNDMYLLLKKSILSSIKYNDVTIKLNYKNAEYAISHHQDAEFFINEALIDNIEFYYKNGLLKKATMGYQNLGGINKRSFLTGIKKEFENQEYKFEYYNTSNLPTYYTNGLDHWGFWNGKDGNTTLAAFDTYNSTTGDYTLNNTIRDPNISKYNVGLLSKVIYPTKGYTVFEYEPPYYGKRVERISSSSFLPTLTNNSGVIGGARILKKTDYSKDGEIAKETKYKYTTDLTSNSSSGILMNWPRYFYYFEFKSASASSITKIMIQTSSNVQQNTFDNYNIGYSKVYEITNGNGYTEHNFYSYEDTPDILAPDVTNIKKYYLPSVSEIIPINLYKNFKNLYGIDKSILRGKIKSKKYYNSNNLLVKEENIAYTDNIDFNPYTNIDDNNYVSIQHLTGAWVQGYKKYFNPYSERVITTKEYLTSGTIESNLTNNFTSPKHLQLTSQVATTTTGTITTKYQYPPDLLGSGKPYMQELTEANRVSEPVTTETLRNGDGLSNKQISYTETLYGKGTNTSQFVLPVEIKANKGGFALETQLTYDRYDDKGNLLQYTLGNGVGTPVSIIWGYNRQYAVAKIEGAAYSELSSYVSNLQSLSDNSSTTEVQMIGALNNLRSQLPNASVTTYTYKPLVGVSTITAPNGITEYYFYDSAGRLQQIQDKDKKVLKTFEYHYKN